MIALSILVGVGVLLIAAVVIGVQRLTRDWETEAEELRGDE